ncbi:DUF3047 domain-containing protein [Mariprofundus sp. EBB-1]|uniref:DUF3047 domain-containing protein n=1 Tax=Mariprofundus sp. EBB-1 TaxID=2650971 RepID=UPI000EF24A30|nr:DUF3047 domain-containing protein [Mariprofundus sp. EBB-1]RLL51926.1 DUF3047 domain-containing protein [Mariprofundus sp. EBB-1]
MPYLQYWKSVIRLFLLSISPVLFSAFAVSSAAVIESHQLQIGLFSQGNIEGWENRSFTGDTEYTLVTDSSYGKVLKASSHAAASGLFRKIHIDLEQTPWINWAWKTEQLYSNLNETEKRGDDFVARLYIVVDGGLFFWNTKALNYVWSSSQATGAVWPNPFTSNATMIAVESGRSGINQWQHYSRNVREDLRKFTGKDIRFIDAIAIMTDSDNSGQKATTYYGDLSFTSHSKTVR